VSTLLPAQLGELCSSIKDLNRNIKSVTIINRLGRAVEKSSSNKTKQPQEEQKNEMLFMQCVLEISMGREFDEEYGPIRYHLSERENSTMLTFPADDNVILVTSNKNISPISLAKKIVNVIDSNRKKPVSDYLITK